MAPKYAAHVSKRVTSQSVPIPGSGQAANSGGGFAWQVDCWTRLDRFLVLGNEGGSYYATERVMTRKNSEAIVECLLLDAPRTVRRIVEISESGRAPKNDPAIFALAKIAGEKGDFGKLALEAMPRVCRTGTHLFQFVEAVRQFRGWSRSLRHGIANWYLTQEPRDLAYQLTKYQQRDGWSHRDLLRLSHPNADEATLTNAMLRWAVGKLEFENAESPLSARAFYSQEFVPIRALEQAKRAASPAEIVRLIREFDLVRECIPTQFLNEPEVWEALLDKMPMTALIRNLATMTRVGLLTPMSSAVRTVCERLTNVDRLKKARIHPLALLAALLTYQAGRGACGQNTWNPMAPICDALDRAFYLAFAAVERTNKRWLLALDVSGSMASGVIAGIPGLTPRVGSAALALVTAAVEPQHQFVAFTTSGWTGGYKSQYAQAGYNNGISPLAISPRQRLDDVVRTIGGLPFGGTDCALPMLYALEHKIPVDVFVVLTDSETWAGNIHPSQALQQYRQKLGIAAKLIICGMVANHFSIADPNDAGMLDVVGFDTSCPQLMSQFGAGF